MSAKSYAPVAVILIFFAVAIRVLVAVAPTLAKVVDDRTLPANYSIFAGFIRFATPTDWVMVTMALVLIVVGVALAIAVQRTRWLPDDR